ncbi:MAG: VOC family protein, partial [Steroidobacteraceae bacterium]
MQVAWVVDDLEASMQKWINGHGVGPFMVLRHCQVTNLLHRGRPTTCDFDVAIAQSGTLQIELIQQHDDLPSVYRDL